MGNRKIKLTDDDDIKTDTQKDRGKLTLNEFFNLHEKFMQDKSLEGLAERTLKDHIIFMDYFKKYIESAYRSELDHVAVNTEIFKSYLYYMLQERNFSPFTVNVRTRTLKCYLKWLYDEKYLNDNIYTKIKLVKVPQDAVQPLKDNDVKKMLKACDLSTYAGFRDYCVLITILDCGVRLNELCELKLADIDTKIGLINIRGEVSKTRHSREIPISSKTCKLLRKLINISENDECEYVFQSTYGGQIKNQNLILSIYRLGKKAGIKQRCTPYVFRHIFATNAVRTGNMDLLTLQRIMGHNTLQTTRKYVQLESEDLKRKHNKANCLDQYLK